MRRFWLSAKIAILFALVLGITLAVTLGLFMRVAGHDLVDELAVLRAYQGIAVAEEIEPMLDEHPPTSAAVRAHVAAAARRRGASMTLVAPPPPAPQRRRRLAHPWASPLAIHRHQVEIEGRVCRILEPPSLATLVPVVHGGQTVATLDVRENLHTPETVHAFTGGLLQIGGLAFASVIALSLYLTLPLRRMSRSMDRIAADELDHRVTVRGHDEVAAMGRSFNAMADRIREMVTGQKELMAGVSHELRSPLTRIKLCLELMRRGGVGSGRLDEIEADIDVLDGLVGELLLASRFDLGAVSLAQESLELSAVAEEAWQRVEATARDAGMELLLALAPGAGEVCADRALMVRVLGNLFENAVRYAGRGAIEVRAEPRAGRVEVTVADAGPGVGEEHLDRLFEPFYRADRSRSRRTGAGGLGLMIVRRAVEAHGGAVRAVRAEAGGLAVTFDLPAAQSPA